MRLFVLFAFCALPVALHGGLVDSPGALKYKLGVLEHAQNQHFSPVNISTANLLTNAGLYDPMCFNYDDHITPGFGPLRNVITLAQCQPLLDTLIEEHDVDMWLRRGQRFHRNHGSCYIAVRGPINQSDNPYVGATYGDLARLMIKILSTCTLDSPGPRRHGKGGRIRIGKGDEEWLGFWLEVQGQPFVWRLRPWPRLPPAIPNTNSVSNATS